MLIKSLHPHIVVKFFKNTPGEEVAKRSIEEKHKSKSAKSGDDDYDSESVDENNWLCNGSDPSLGFKDGCKSG